MAVLKHHMLDGLIYSEKKAKFLVRYPKTGLSDARLPGLYKSEIDEYLLSIIKGHLILEYAICQLLIAKGEGRRIWKWAFPKKVETLKNYCIIAEWVLDICIDVNNLRNDFCHSLGHSITFEESWGLAKRWSSLGLEYSDGGMFEDEDYARECYPPTVVIDETIVNLMILEFDPILQNYGLKTTFENDPVNPPKIE